MKKVSVIVPVYNGAKFIKKCLDCLINQTYQNVEIILLDDGSTDNSLELLKEYEDKYDNVFSYTHSNVGLSQTRNIGLSYCTGDYVTYLDVDDYFDYDFIGKYMEVADNNDIVIGGYRRVYENGESEFTYVHEISRWSMFKRATVWAKVYKKSFLDSNNIKYPDARLYGEDVVYTMRCLSCNPIVKIIDYVGYNNLINAQSITHQNKDRLINDVPKIIENINIFIKNNNEFLKKNSKIVKYYYLKLFSNFLIEQAEFLDEKKLQNYYSKNITDIKKIFKDYGYKLSFCWEKSEPIKVNIFLNLVVLFEKIRAGRVLVKMLNICFYKKDNKYGNS
ncbi:glycosyltransferase [Thomasclavelia cocleata]|jgi:glycosyltransferase involved in cell wall biosynthesis|uniref:glycosyltransferase n=5 Tax=Thomasclavelia cocleata TaxID=69824 RepID=UPI00241DB434|nr:glycosyltransferase [Thomasclavelia cocleata]